MKIKTPEETLKLVKLTNAIKIEKSPSPPPQKKKKLKINGEMKTPEVIVMKT